MDAHTSMGHIDMGQEQMKYQTIEEQYNQLKRRKIQI